MRKPTLFRKLFYKLLLISLFGFFVLLFLGRLNFKNFYLDEKALHLKNIATVLHDPVSNYLESHDYNSLQEYIKNKTSDNKQRISVVLVNGDVVADTEKSPKLLDNHINRPEIGEALKGKVGRSLRYSNSLKEESIYVAIPVYGQEEIIGVLRHSYITHDLKPVLRDFTWNFFWGTFLIGIILLIYLTISTKKFATSLTRIQEKAKAFAQGDFKELIPANSKEPYEISSLIKSLNEMAEKLGDLFGKIDRQRNEREAIFTGMSEGVLSVYMDGNIFHLNQSVCHFFDVPYNNNYKGTPLLEVFRNTQIINFLEKVKSEKYFIEEEFQLANGKTLLVHGSILKKGDNEELGILLVFNDITQVRKLEDHRKEFVANVSHELRTPLTSIQGYIETLIEGKVDSEEIRNKFLLTIKRNSERLEQITEDLLTLSELDKENTNDVIKLEVLPLKNVVRDAVELCKDKGSNKDIEIQFTDEADASLAINPRLLEQALVNLIDNAIKYSEKNTTVSILIQKENSEISIAVKDQGAGIEESHLARLFERFYSVNKARSREMGGSGLGLSIVKNIALAHNAKVDVNSALGVGTTFFIRFPIKSI